MTPECALRTRVVRRIVDIPVADWIKVFPEASENYYFFKTLDESGFDQFTFFYIMVYEGDRPVGATSCFLMNFALDMTVTGLLRSFLSAVKKVFPVFLCPKILMCGLPMGQGRIGIAKDSPFALQAILDAMEEIAKEHKATLINFKDLDMHHIRKFGKVLRKAGFTEVESLPSTEMYIRFNSFDEYLKSLSRVSRDGLKRKFKQIDGKIKVDLEVTSHLDDLVLADVYALYRQTLERQDLSIEVLPQAFFKKISENMPDEVKFFLWRLDKKLVAFAFCLVKGDQFIDYYLGFDYGVAYQYHLYFVRSRDLMNWCITHKMKRYEMGSTAYEPKRRMGFEFIRLFFYMKHRNPLINPFVKVLSPFLGPKHFDPVFKDIGRMSAQ